MMNKIKIIGVVILMSFFMTACSNLNSNFDCPMKNGVRCESLDQVNARIDRGEIGIDNSHKTINKTNTYLDPNSVIVGSIDQDTMHRPLRYAETVQKLWIAPFEDKEGNYHAASDIFVITKNGNWKGLPVKEIGEND